MAPNWQITYNKNPQSLQGTNKESATTNTLIGSKKGFCNRLNFKNPLRKNTEESKGYIKTKKSTKSKRQKAVFKYKILIKY